MTTRVLCVQLADIGDLVLTTPALRYLRNGLPGAHIAVLTTPHAAPVLPPGLVDEVLMFPKHLFDDKRALLNLRNVAPLMKLAGQLRRGHYNTTIFFHHYSTRFGMLKFAGLAAAARSVRRVGLLPAPFLNEGVPDAGFGAQHQAEYWLQLVSLLIKNPPAPAPPLEIHISDEDRAWATSRLPEGRPRIAVHAGSGGYSTARRWDPTRFQAVVERLQAEHGGSLVLVGGPGDDRIAPNASATDLLGETTLGQLGAVLEQCDLFIGADSGVMHIAAAAGTRVVAVFGPSNHRAWHPWTDVPHAIVRSGPVCSPCSYVGTGVGLRDGCPARTCMRMVTVEAMVDAANDVSGAVGARGSLHSPAPLHAVRGDERRARDDDRLRILGLPVDALTYDDFLARIGEWVDADNGCHQICTLNPEFCVMARRDVNFRHVLQRAHLNTADGVGITWAAKLLGKPLPGRVTGSDGVPKIAERAAQAGWKLFLLGAGPGVAQQAADVLRRDYPGLNIVGVYGGSPAAEEEDAIVQRVNASGADMLLVAYGAPKQDKWIARNAPRLNVKVAMGIGGTLDYVAGVVTLAPEPMRRAGLEWLYRLVTQPRRARRMLRLPVFALLVVLQRVQSG